MKIGLISDTHGFLDHSIMKALEGCDQIWHAGDIGPGVAEELSKHFDFHAVHGNIDDRETRIKYPEFLEIILDGIKILITHIAGKPPKYNHAVREKLNHINPRLLICGHSHLVCALKDPKRNNLLFLNPGAAGMHGFHQMRTLMTFSIENEKISGLKLIELGKRGQIKDPSTGE